MSWQTEALRVVTETALGMGAVRVVPVGSLATHDLDRWSDLDALIVVPDGRLAQFWPDRGWLQPLGEVAAYETSKHPEDASIRLLLAAGRRVDVLVAEQRSVETRLARLADTIPVVDAATIAAAGDRLIFEAATVVGHAARGERLIATHLAFGLLERCLEAALVLRDLGTGTCVHRHATEYDALADLLPAVPAAPGADDLLDLVAAALDCFERIVAGTGTRFARAVIDRLVATARTSTS